VFDRQVCMAASPIGNAVVRVAGPRGPRDQRGPGQGKATPGRPATSWPAARTAVAGPPPANGRGAQLALAERLARSGVRCAQVPAAVATPSFVDRAHALGLQVHAWTVNQPDLMGSLLDIGVDGIMTDETVALRDVLVARGEWHPRPAG
jgi:glycerophosphoryl diester phosphodiesterase